MAKKIILEFQINQELIEQTKLKIIKLNTAMSKYKKISKENQSSQLETNKGLSIFKDKVKEANDKLRELVKQQKLVINWQKANKGSVDKLRAANIILTKRLNALNQTTEIGRKRAEAYKKVIDRNIVSIDKMTDATQRQKANIGNYTESILKAASALDKLNNKNNILKQRLTGISDATEKGRKRIKAYERAINKNNIAINKMSENLKRQKANINKNTTALKGVGKSLASLATGFLGITTLIYASIRAIKSAIEINREFEKTFVSILGLLDEIQKREFGEILKQGAIDIMGKYGLEIADVNKALFDTISNGIAAGDAIEFLDKSARLAIAGSSDLTSVIKGATKVYAVYKDEVEDIDEILNAFFAAQVKGATTVELLANNIGKIASIAHFAGIPIAELFGTFAELTKFLDGTEESATALTATITALLKVKPGTKQAAAFKKLGIEVGATAIQSNGLLNTLVKVAKAAETNADELTILIPNIRALKGIAGLTTTTIAELKQNILDLNDAELSAGLVTKAFGEQMEVATKQVELRKSAWKKYIITIQQGEGAFKGFNKTLKNVFDLWTQMAEQAQFFKESVDENIGEASIESLENMLKRGIEIYERLELEGRFFEADMAFMRNEAIKDQMALIKSGIGFQIKKFVEELDAAKKAEDDKADLRQKELDDIQAANDKKIAENEETERILLETRKKFGLLSTKELYDKDVENFLKSEAAKILSAEETAIVLENIRLKAFGKQEEEERKLVTKKQILTAEEIEALIESKEEEFQEWVDAEGEEILAAILLSGKLIKIAETEADVKSELRKRTIDEAIKLGNDLFNFSASLSNRQSTFLERQLKKDLKAAGDNEKKREEIERKFAIETAKITRKQAILDKAQAILNVGINMILALSAVASTGGGTKYADFGISAGILSALIIGQGIALTAAILAKPLPEIPSFSKGKIINKKGEMLQGPSHAEGGMKLYGEGEGGEAIINQKSTALFGKELSDINSYKGWGNPLYSGHSNYYQDGGVTTQVEATKIEIVRIPVLVLEDVHDIEDTQQQIEVLETF